MQKIIFNVVFEFLLVVRMNFIHFSFVRLLFLFLLYSKTKNRQWILFISSGRTEEERKEETKKCYEEVKRSHDFI